MEARKICAACTATKCVECPSESPLLVECPSCGGAECSECNHRGTFELRECPYGRYVDQEMADLVKVTRYARRGLYPLAGGSFEQCNWFMEASEFLRSEQDRLRPLSAIEQMFGGRGDA